MPTAISIGHLEAHEKLTARVFFQPDGDDGYFDLGNVKEYNEAHEYSAVTRVVAEKGVRRTTDEQVEVMTAAWEFTLDEVDTQMLKMLRQGTLEAGESQADVTAPSGTASIAVTTANLGRWLDIGKVGLDTLVVKDDAMPTPATLVRGINYEVDLDAGMIRFLTNAGDTCALTFGTAAVDYEVVTGMDSPTYRGAFILHEYNQFSKVPLRTTTFEGTLLATEFPSHTGEFATYKFKATARNKPTTKRRSEA